MRTPITPVYCGVVTVSLVFAMACTADPPSDPSGDTSTSATSSVDTTTESSSTTVPDSTDSGSTSTPGDTSSSESSTSGTAADPVSIAVAVGHTHTCVIADAGQMKCWGTNGGGELGQADTTPIGDDETPATIGAIDLGGVAVQASAGQGYTCAVLEGGTVRCWGYAGIGHLGYGNLDNIGDDETPASAGDVDVGGVVVQITAGEGHTCARLDSGAVRCWGSSSNGQLGYGNQNPIGDDETPAVAGDVPLGGTAVWISAGRTHTCAVLDGGAVRCWGNSFAGALGYGNELDVGDDETPESVGDVQVGFAAAAVEVGYSNSCARTAAGLLRCWGDGQVGATGYGNVDIIGDDEVPSVAGDVDVGGAVGSLTLGHNGFVCALLDGGAVRCWGNNFFGSLGYGNMMNIGDDELPSSAGDVDIGGGVTDLSSGYNHTCAVVGGEAVRCWGNGLSGALGYGNVTSIGDDEVPAVAGDVEVW